MQGKGALFQVLTAVLGLGLQPHRLNDAVGRFEDFESVCRVVEVRHVLDEDQAWVDLFNNRLDEWLREVLLPIHDCG